MFNYIAEKERMKKKLTYCMSGIKLRIYDFSVTAQTTKPQSQTKVSLPIPSYNCQVVYTPELESRT